LEFAIVAVVKEFIVIQVRVLERLLGLAHFSEDLVPSGYTI
jgi:hypothetical protein